MQNLINANRKSVTETMMNDTGQVIPFYSETKSFPPLGIQFHTQSPTIGITGAVANKSILFDLPSGGGFLYNMSVSLLFTCTVATADLTAANNFPGLNCWRYLQFESGGKILVYKTKNSLYAQLRKMQSAEFKNYSFRYANFLNPTTEEIAVATDTSFLTYIPFIDTFLSGPEKALLLDNLKDLKLRIMFDTTVASGLTNAITAVTATLVAQSYMPTLSIFDEMKIKNWSKPFVMDMINCDEETLPLQSATTSTIQINTSFLAVKSHLFIRQNNTTGQVGLPVKKINSIEFKLNGTSFIDTSILPSRINECAARYGNSTAVCDDDFFITYDSTTDKIITFDWGVLCSRKVNSGTAFWSELRGSTIKVNYDSDAAYADYTLYLVHEYIQGVEFNPNPGTLTIVSVD